MPELNHAVTQSHAPEGGDWRFFSRVGLRIGEEAPVSEGESM